MNITQVEKNLIPQWIMDIIEETYNMLSKEKVRVSKVDEITSDEVKVEIFPINEVSVTLLILNKIATRLQDELSTQDDEKLNKIIKDVVLGYPLILSAVTLAMSNIELVEKTYEEFKGITEEVKKVYKAEEEFFWGLILNNPQVIGLEEFPEEFGTLSSAIYEDTFGKRPIQKDGPNPVGTAELQNTYFDFNQTL